MSLANLLQGLAFDLDGYGPFILKGMAVTLALAIASLALACLLGALGAWGKLSGSPVARLISQLYTSVVRGIPDYVLILLIYFGGQIIINRVGELLGYRGYVEVNPFVTGVFALGLIFGTYMTETFRAAFLAIPRGQIEAARALGISNSRLLVRILIPQMMFHGLPAFGNIWLVLVKTTAIVSLIGLNDMMRRAGAAAGTTQKPFKFYLFVSILFLLVTSVSTLLIKKTAERRSLGFRKQ